MNIISIFNKASLVAMILSTWACQPNDNSKETVDTQDNTVIVPIKATPVHVSSCYHHLTGTLGDMNIVAELVEQDNEAENEGGLLNGYYLYEQYGGPIALYGSFNKQGQIKLVEQGTWDGEPHRIIGKWNSSGSFEGEWISGNNKDRLPVLLDSPEHGFLPLVCRKMEDSIIAFPSWHHSPQAVFSAHWFEVQSDNKTLNAFLNKAIKTALQGEWSTDEGREKDVISLQKKAYFEDYKSEINALIQEDVIDTLAGQDDLYSFNYNLAISMDVYYNSLEILTIGYTHYSYTGGAHGIYGTEVSSYNLKTYKEVSLKDVFKDGYEKAVSEQLANAVRIKFELGEDVPLSQILYEDAIEPNQNFGITGKGIFFVYTPYEIAPYSAGEIELFVAFDRLGDYVKEKQQQD